MLLVYLEKQKRFDLNCSRSKRQVSCFPSNTTSSDFVLPQNQIALVFLKVILNPEHLLKHHKDLNKLLGFFCAI